MVSFNILGVCTSRDIFSRTKNNYIVNKYTLGFSPLFCFENSITGSVSLNDFLNISYPKGRSNFLRRADYIEYSRSVFDFLCENKSDYLILDLAMLRSSYFMTEGNSFFVGSSKQRIEFYKRLVDLFNFPKIKKTGISYNFLDRSDIVSRLDLYTNRLLQIYPSNKIILCNHKLSRFVKNGNTLSMFKNFDIKWPGVNDFLQFCFDCVKLRLPECHVIDFLDNAVADARHPLGYSPLHFTTSYYQYFKECIDCIMLSSDKELESKRLSIIKDKYNKKYAATYFRNLQQLVLKLNSSHDKIHKILDDL